MLKFHSMDSDTLLSHPGERDDGKHGLQSQVMKSKCGVHDEKVKNTFSVGKREQNCWLLSMYKEYLALPGVP